jgi:hypothetical protein
LLKRPVQTHAFIFGIRDLHAQNLIFTATHLQPIDAEVVLTDLSLPNETILLPFKDTVFDSCGLRPLANSISDIDSTDRSQIFAGYFDLFAAMSSQRRAIIDTFANQSLRVPIRLILRNTREYQPYLHGAASLDSLLKEERTQVERGDVPYFFKHCDDANLYWLSKPGTISSVETDLGAFKPDVDRHAKNPARLLGDENGLVRKMVQGAFLLQKQFADSDRREFRWCGDALVLSLEGCEISSVKQIFRKKV